MATAVISSDRRIARILFYEQRRVTLVQKHLKLMNGWHWPCIRSYVCPARVRSYRKPCWQR